MCPRGLKRKGAGRILLLVTLGEARSRFPSILLAGEGLLEGAWRFALAQDHQETEVRGVAFLAQGHRDSR